MRVTTRNGITTRNDGLPYDIKYVADGHYEFRATAGETPVVIATTRTHFQALEMLILQAPEIIG